MKTKIRILTLNVWGEGEDRDKRWPLMAKAIGGLKPDFVGLQEVFRPEDLSEVKKAGSFASSFTPAHKTGLGLLTQGEIEQSTSLMLSPSPLEEYQRYVILSRIRFGGMRIHFYNTHLSWKPEDSESRDRQSEAILGFLHKQPAADLDILTGDLNTVESTLSVQKLTAYFSDLYRTRNHDNGYTWSHRNPYTLRASELPERRIDYIMAGGAKSVRMRVLNAEVVFDKPFEEIWISDHFGVCCDIELD